MWKLNNKEGFALIEVLCSLILISLFINGILIILVNSVKVHTDDMKRQKYICFLDALSKEIEWNLSYDDVTDIKDKHDIYIDKTHMDLESLKQSSIKQLLSNIKPVEQPYIEISIVGDNILNINMNLFYKAFGEQNNININCYKGRYK